MPFECNINRWQKLHFMLCLVWPSLSFIISRKIDVCVAGGCEICCNIKSSFRKNFQSSNFHDCFNLKYIKMWIFHCNFNIAHFCTHNFNFFIFSLFVRPHWDLKYQQHDINISNRVVILDRRVRLMTEATLVVQFSNALLHQIWVSVSFSLTHPRRCRYVSEH